MCSSDLGAVTTGDDAAVSLAGVLRAVSDDDVVLEGSFSVAGTVLVVPTTSDTCAAVETLDADGDGAVAEAYGGSDCDDDAPTVYAGAQEVCGGLDDDCDGLTDLDDPSLDPTSFVTWHLDLDGDGYGDPDTSLDACEPPEGYVADGADCDDGDPTVSPGATERCDADDLDEDCDGDADDADADVDPASASTWYLDLDGDTYGDDADAGTLACDVSGGRTAPTSGDCDDADAAIHPGAAELCDAADTDEDCDGAADDAEIGRAHV